MIASDCPQTGNDNIHFMMNMPYWYINLSDEEKINLAKKYAEDSQSDQSLTSEQIAELLRISS